MEEPTTSSYTVLANSSYSNGSLDGPFSGSTDVLLISSDHSILKYVILVSYMTTFIFGLLGNSLVIYIIGHFVKVRLKSVANYYIWNLALADELFILVLPLFCYATFTKDWPFGAACCKIAYAFREINKFASFFTMVALSFDRYLASCYQLSYLRTIQGCLVALSETALREYLKLVELITVAKAPVTTLPD